ncbi:MAG: hypothetical protein H6741_31175 [Alphaproteobacteria bacterium]|nr:hypothetical protein [Alphaproteobacteria bacterium]
MHLLLVLIACSPYRDLEDRWTDAYAICQPPEPFSRDTPTALPISEACKERLIEDFGVVDTFEEPAVREWVFEGLYNVLGRDQGLVSELEADDFVRAPFIERTREQAERLGTDSVAATLYSFAAFEIERIEDSDRAFDGFRYLAEERSVLINLTDYVVQNPDSPEGADWAVSFVHEATHAVVPRHVRCESYSNLWCDTDWGGAYGAHIATAELMWRSCDPYEEFYNCHDLESQRDNALWRIEEDR